MPVHSINTFFVFILIFVWSPKTCKENKMLKNVTAFLATTLVLTPFVIQKDDCHLLQLKKPLSIAPTFTILTRIAAVFIFKFMKQKEERDRPDSHRVTLYTEKHTNLQISQYPVEKPNQQTSGHLLVANWFCTSRAPRLSRLWVKRLHLMCDVHMKAALDRS